MVSEHELISIKNNWRSLRPDKRHKWSFEACRRICDHWKQQLPVNVLIDIEKGTMANLNLVRLKDALMHTPKASDVEDNFIWLLPLVDMFPTKIPPGYFVQDCFYLLDQLLAYRLFLAEKLENPKAPVFVSEALKEYKMSKVAKEAAKLVRVFGYLRYLFRESKSSGRPKIAELKSKLGQRRSHMLRLRFSTSCKALKGPYVPSKARGASGDGCYVASFR